MMLQPDPCGSVLSSLMGIVAVVAARNLENTLTLVLVRTTADGGAMFTLLTKLLLPQKHHEVKEQALEALKLKSRGKKNVG